MYTFILVCHVIIAVFIVITVLLQSGKGGGLGAGMGGGGANTLFGSSGGSNFFTKLTMGLAAAFFITSLGLTVIKSRTNKSSIFDNAKVPVTAPTPTTSTAPVTSPAPAPAAPQK